MTPAEYTGRSQQHGFSLIEVLISMLVLSLGMLSLAALFISSLSTSHAASQRSQATFLAYDIIESMRANRKAALASCYTATAACSNPVARNDLTLWQAQIRRTLPDGSGTVSMTGTRATVEVSWDEGKTNEDGVPLRAAFSTDTGI